MGVIPAKCIINREICNGNSVVSVMNGHPRDQAKVSVHCRWPLIRGTDGHVENEMSRDIENMAIHSRRPLTTGVTQGRYYCLCNGNFVVTRLGNICV